jgi:hypothetical protein
MAGVFFVAAQGQPPGSYGGHGSTAIALVVAVVAAIVLIRLLRAAWRVIAPLVRPVLALAGALVTVIIVIVVLLGGTPDRASAEVPVSPGHSATSAHAAGRRQL